MADANTYWILGGDGEVGEWERFDGTKDELAAKLETMRSHEGSWARAVEDAFETVDDGWAGYDAETGEVTPIPTDLIHGKTEDE